MRFGSDGRLWAINPEVPISFRCCAWEIREWSRGTEDGRCRYPDVLFRRPASLASPPARIASAIPTHLRLSHEMLSSRTWLSRMTVMSGGRV
jgi:hypothetical protein